MRTRTFLTAFLVTFSMAALAGAQTPPTTRPVKPATRPLPAEQLLDNMLQPTVAPGQPLQPIIEKKGGEFAPGSGAVAPSAPQVALVREGSILEPRVGRLTRSADGKDMEFTFEADAKNMKDPPMILLPNSYLAAMEDAVSAASRDLRFKVSGVITEYHGRNYLLLQTLEIPADATTPF
jgi:hypothetical protein